jgi:hypothetical protein
MVSNISNIIKIFMVVVAMFLAIYLGVIVVTDQMEALLWVAAVTGLTVCIWLGRNIWLLIPATMYLNLSFPWLPGGLPPSQIAVLVVLGWCMVLIAMRKLPLEFRFTEIEIAALLLLATIFQCYVRNPVGLLAMGSTNVGAKPYFNVVVATMGAILLASLRVTPERLVSARNWMLTGSLFSWVTNSLAFFIPSVAAVTGKLLGAWGRVTQADFGMNVDPNAPVDSTAATRIGPAVEGASLLSRWLCSVRNPFRAMINPLWGGMVLASIAMAGLSGYRNTLIATGFTLAFATYYWGRRRAVLGASFMALIGYVLLVIINPIAPLPPNIQRTLTIIPGTWEDKYKEDAKASSEWRVEMWKLVLFTDRYIENKYIGDGLGLTQKEYLFLQNLGSLKMLSSEMTQERALMTQAYHSGPVQTVRVTGYVGLIVLLFAMIVVAVRAHRLILRYRGTEWFGTILFMTLHMVWHPIFFVFVFGAFKEDMPALLMNMGILRLLEKNLPKPFAPQNTGLAPVPAPGQHSLA